MPQFVGKWEATQGDGSNAAAPPLGAIIGRKSGGSNFAYSKAMKSSGMIWTRENFYLYIKAPAKFIPGNQMGFGGISDDQQRADLLAYMETTKR